MVKRKSTRKQNKRKSTKKKVSIKRSKSTRKQSKKRSTKKNIKTSAKKKNSTKKKRKSTKKKTNRKTKKKSVKKKKSSKKKTKKKSVKKKKYSKKKVDSDDDDDDDCRFQKMTNLMVSNKVEKLKEIDSETRKDIMKSELKLAQDVEPHKKKETVQKFNNAYKHSKCKKWVVLTVYLNIYEYHSACSEFTDPILDIYLNNGIKVNILNDVAEYAKKKDEFILYGLIKEKLKKQTGDSVSVFENKSDDIVGPNPFTKTPVVESSLPVTGGTESTVTGGTESSVFGGTESAVTGGTESSVFGGTESSVFGGTESAVTGGTESSVFGGTESAVTGGTESAVTGGTESGLEKEIDDILGGSSTEKNQMENIAVSGEYNSEGRLQHEVVVGGVPRSLDLQEAGLDNYLEKLENHKIDTALHEHYGGSAPPPLSAKENGPVSVGGAFSAIPSMTTSEQSHDDIFNSSVMGGYGETISESHQVHNHDENQSATLSQAYIDGGGKQEEEEPTDEEYYTDKVKMIGEEFDSKSYETLERKKDELSIEEMEEFLNELIKYEVDKNVLREYWRTVKSRKVQNLIINNPKIYPR